MASEVIRMLPPFSPGTLALGTVLRRGSREESGPSSTAQQSCQPTASSDLSASPTRHLRSGQGSRLARGWGAHRSCPCRALPGLQVHERRK